MKKLLMVVPIMLLGASMSFAQTHTATSSLSVTVGPEAALTATAGPLTSTGIFGNYTGTTSLTYYVRTTGSGGGTVTVEITTDFSTGGANGGPSVATPPDPADLLTYSSASPGPAIGTATGCTGPVTALTTAATNVLTFVANTQSLKAGSPASTSWTLVNDPNYKAGTYTAVATYTISAT